MAQPHRGAIAECSLGTRGLILRNEKQWVNYSDGNSGHAYVGVHLDDHPHLSIEAGDQWSSRNPEVVDSIRDSL